jgi:uncharacterized protein YggT (Ycf19 family)
MTENVQKVSEQTRTAGENTVQTKEVYPVTSRRDQRVSKVQYFIQTLFGVLLVLLAVRIVLSLFGANPDNPFANFIYSVSNPFVAPFRGLFGYDLDYGVSRFEIETLVAMIMYGLLGWIIVRLVALGKRDVAHQL